VTKLVPVNTKSGVMHYADIRKPPYESCAEYSNKYIYDDMDDVDARCLHGDTQTNTLCNIRPHYENMDFLRKRQFDLMECVLPDEDPRETNDRENRVANICPISEDESNASDAPVTDTDDDDNCDSDEECVNMGGCCGHGIISTTTMATQTPSSCLRVLAAVAQVATPMAEPVEPAEPANAAAYGDVTEGEEDEDEDCVWIPPVPASVLDSSDDAPYTLEQMKVYVQHIPWSYDTTPGSADGSSLSPVQQIHKNFEEFNRGFKTTRSGRKYT